jgi:thiol-disulfide isomerase/thioredoxin
MRSGLFFFIIFVTAFTAIAKPVTIKGKINGKLPETLRYTAPVNGASGFDIYYTAKVDAKGNFEIIADIDEVSFIDIFYNYLWAGNIVAAPGGQYTLTITENEGKVTNAITGTDDALQKRYAGVLPLYRITLMYNLAKEAAKIESPVEFEAFFDSKYNADISAIHTASPPGYLRPLLYERQYFYATAMSMAIFLKHSHVRYNGGAPVAESFNILWKGLYDKVTPDNEYINKLPVGYWYLMGYEYFKTYEEVGFDVKKIIDNTELSHEEIRKKHLRYIPAQNAEYYLAVSQHQNVYEGQMEKYALESYLDFKKAYPNSSYTKFLEPEMAPLVAFYSQSGALPQGSAFVDEYANINSLEELIKKFPGKKLYIDVWATWCGPCRDEFKYKDELYKLLAANNITVVYISIDRDARDEGWKKMISHYGLQGYHIRANKALDSSVSHHFSGTESISIPWYILIGSKGEIAVRYAAPPSDLDKLKKEINTL